MISDSHSTPVQTWEQVQNAAAVPAQTHEEGHALAQAEYERLLPVVEALEGKDWQQPTYCTEWTVRDLVAHLAGGAATFSSWGEFQRHYLTNPYKEDWNKPEEYCN